MRHINYKSDFDFILKLVSSVKQNDGTITKSEVGFPDHDWEATFWTSRRSTSFIASSKGGVLTNCFNDNGQIHIVCNNRGLGPGVLNVEFHAHVPNSMYPDKCMDMYTVVPLDIELVIGQSDCMTELDAEVGLPIMYRSVYEDAVSAGFNGTKEEYYQRLNELPDSVEVATTIRQSVEDIRAMVADTAAGKAKLIDALERQGFEVSEGESYIELAAAVDKGYLSTIGYDTEEDYIVLKAAIEQSAKAKAQYEANGGNLSTCGIIAPNVQTTGAYLLQGNGDVTIVPSYRGLTNCDAMFARCVKLINIPPLDMSNVTRTVGMFSGCSSLVYVPPMDLRNVIAATFMFRYCSALTEATLDMPNIPDAINMFEDCKALTKVSLNMPNVTDATNMFDTCSSLTEVSLNMPNVTNATYMFYYCSALTEVPLEMTHVTNANNMFNYCSALTEVSLDMPNVTDATKMFYYCKALTEASLNMPNVTTATSMFDNCSSLTKVSLNTTKVTTATKMFYYCEALTEATLDMPNATTASNMFSYCKALTKVSLNMPNVTTASNMFNNCSALTEVSLVSQNMTDASYLFSGCSSLRKASLDMSSVTKVTSTFNSLTAVVVFNITNLGKSSLTSYSFNQLSVWGSTEEGRQSLIDTLITNSYKRASNGMSACRITLHANVKALLTTGEIASITAKGFTIA